VGRNDLRGVVADIHITMMDNQQDQSGVHDLTPFVLVHNGDLDLM
jgi:hypothetical protein